jgi:hypothetical protein
MIGSFDRLRPFDKLRMIGSFDRLRTNGFFLSERRWMSALDFKLWCRPNLA